MTFTYYWMPAAVASVWLVARAPAARWVWVAIAYVAVLSVSCRAGVLGAVVCLLMLGLTSERVVAAVRPPGVRYLLRH